MGLLGMIFKSVEVMGDGDATFVALCKKWNEIFKRTDFSKYFWNVAKPKENPSTLEEALTTLVTDDFTIKYWQDTYQGLWSLDGKVWFSHSRRFECSYKDSGLYSAHYQIHLEYTAGGKTLVLEYITGEADEDGDYEGSALRLQFFTADGSINKVATASGETEHSDGVYPPEMFKAMESPKTEERLRNFLRNLDNVVSSADRNTRMAKAAAERGEAAQQEEVEKPEMNAALDDALGDL